MTRSCLLVLLALPALPASAEPLTLAQCTRTTHVSHGGESDHADLGEGRVMWTDWWSQEGTATDITLMDCAEGRLLTFRSAETNMTRGRSSFDRTDLAMDVIARHEGGARAFATFERIAADLDKTARDIEIATVPHESCACAALYPEMRGDKAAFVLSDEIRPWP